VGRKGREQRANPVFADDVGVQFHQQMRGADRRRGEKVDLVALHIHDDHVGPPFGDHVGEGVAFHFDLPLRLAPVVDGGGDDIVALVESHGRAIRRDGTHAQLRYNVVPGVVGADRRLQRGVGLVGQDIALARDGGRQKPDKADAATDLQNAGPGFEVLLQQLPLGRLIAALVETVADRGRLIRSAPDADSVERDFPRAGEAFPVQSDVSERIGHGRAFDCGGGARIGVGATGNKRRRGANLPDGHRG
jgi:hypothetical protein